MGVDSCPGADCLQCCGECWVSCVTIISIIVGVFVFVIGLLLILALTVLTSTVDQFLSSSLGAMLSTYASSSTLSTSSLFAGVMIVGIALLITGVGLIVFGAVGCNGSCKKSTCCTATYAGFWGLLILGEMIIVIWYATNQTYWIGMFNETAIYNIQTYYADVWQVDMNTWSLTWNAMMYANQCCGYTNYTDFYSSTLWYTTDRLNVSCHDVFAYQEVPVACCPSTGSIPAITPNDYCCLTKPTTDNSYIGTPCYAALQTQFYALYGYIVGVGTAVGGLEILFFLMLVFLTIRYNKVDAKKA